MIQTYFDYYPDFHCLAGRCPDTCCKDWQIILDPDALARYRALSGALGAQVRASLVEEDGEVRFAERDGHCALLTPDGLCSLQCALGEQALCKTCAAHPRFIEQYGALEECTLSISCPAAAELLLRRQTPLRFITTEDARPLEDYNTLDPALYRALERARAYAVTLVQDDTLLLRERMSLLLLFSRRLQSLLDAGQPDRIDALIARFSSRAYLHRQRTRLRRMHGHSGTFLPLWLLLRNMEHLGEEFPRLLTDALHAEPQADFWHGVHAQALENLLVYFLFRYFKKAVNDGRLLARVSACIFHMLSVRQLYYAQPDRSRDALIRLCSLYSKEVEHSEENMALLLRAFSRRTPAPSTLLFIL